MAQHAKKPVVKKPTTGKKGKRATGNSSKKPAAAMNMITSEAGVLAIPLGEIPVSLSRIDLDRAVNYDVRPHVPTKGQYKGVNQKKFLFTTPDGNEHSVYEALALALGEAMRTSPILAVQLIAYERDVRPQAS